MEGRVEESDRQAKVLGHGVLRLVGFASALVLLLEVLLCQLLVERYFAIWLTLADLATGFDAERFGSGLRVFQRLGVYQLGIVTATVTVDFLELARPVGVEHEV